MKTSIIGFCPVCQHDQSRIIRTEDVVFGTEEQFVYLSCKVCGHMRLDFTAAKEKFREPAGSFVESVMEHRLVSRIIYQPRIHWLAQCIELNHESAVLDVGCGTGKFLGLLKQKYGCHCVGIDLESSFAAIAVKPEINFVTADFEEFESHIRFDLITMFHVIEHFADPELAIQKAYDMLNPGGYLCIETPASDSFAFNVFKGHWLPLLPPYHINIFSRQSLNLTLRKYFSHGWQVKSTSVYVPGEIVGSACLPLAKFIPHPFQKQSQPFVRSIVAIMGMCFVLRAECWTELAGR